VIRFYARLNVMAVDCARALDSMPLAFPQLPCFLTFFASELLRQKQEDRRSAVANASSMPILSHFM